MIFIRPIIKWPGGKERELNIIKKGMPNDISDYVEPFLGGGAVFFDMAESHISGKHYINDFSSELVQFYTSIKNKDPEFYLQLNTIAMNLKNIENHIKTVSAKFTEGHSWDVESSFETVNNALKETSFSLIGNIACEQETFDAYIEDALKRKISSIAKLVSNGTPQEDFDFDAVIETIYKAAFYTLMRKLYNEKNSDVYNIPALFFYIREYCYSSMFRFNDKGEFNVPYGGMSYNSNDFEAKTRKLANADKYLSKARIENKDFEDFLMGLKLDENSFIFLDPPYDSEFSEYDQNAFTRDDQTRLADTLTKINGKVMVVIKNTDFIYNLYKDRGFNIYSFEKKYSVNFKNRNIRDVDHLMITNYEIEWSMEENAT